MISKEFNWFSSCFCCLLPHISVTGGLGADDFGNNLNVNGSSNMVIFQTGIYKGSPETDLSFITGGMGEGGGEGATSSLGKAGRQLEEREGREGAGEVPQQQQQTTIKRMPQFLTPFGGIVMSLFHGGALAQQKEEALNPQ